MTRYKVRLKFFSQTSRKHDHNIMLMIWVIHLYFESQENVCSCTHLSVDLIEKQSTEKSREFIFM